MKLTATEFLNRVNTATVAAMEILAQHKEELTAVDYILLDKAIADSIARHYKEAVTIETADIYPYNQLVEPVV